MRNLRCSGYTLIELLLTISIVMILVVMASPIFYDIYQRIARLATAQRIINELNLARNIAITKQEQITYQPKESDAWHLTRMITDRKGDCLHRMQSLPEGYKLILRNSLNRNNAIIFTPLGFTLSQRCSFYLSNANNYLRIVVSLSGRVRLDNKSLSVEHKITDH